MDVKSAVRRTCANHGLDLLPESLLSGLNARPNGNQLARLVLGNVPDAVELQEKDREA